MRRVWRLQARIAPSQKKSPWAKDGYTKKYPFSIKPDKKLSVRDVMSFYRDYYQGTDFDQSKGVTAGPFGCPYRYPGPMDAGGDTGDPNAKLRGAWERAAGSHGQMAGIAWWAHIGGFIISFVKALGQRLDKQYSRGLL